jgi:RNA-binding protein
MRRVGTVTRVAQRLAVARVDPSGDGGAGGGGDAGGDDGEPPPSVGASVVDENLRTVGRVVDVFGPVERPYVAVSPGEGVAAADLLGRKLYAR